MRSRVIAYFAVLGVALCVAMMLIVVSVMNGFLDKIENAAKGLFGDIVIEPAGQRGIALYDEFIAELKQKVPEVTATGPFILCYGFMEIPNRPAYMEPVQIAGIRLPERADVSDFEDGLYFQGGAAAPTWDPNIFELDRRVTEEINTALAIMRRLRGDPDANSPIKQDTIDRIRTALVLQREASDILANAKPYADQMQALEKKLAEKVQTGASPDELEDIRDDLTQLGKEAGYKQSSRRVILGVSTLSFRTDEGETVRYLVPGQLVMLSVVPLGRGVRKTGISLNSRPFTVIDDCRTDVSSVDSQWVYVPLETLQLLSDMDDPPRCHQIHVKVAGGISAEADLRKIARKVRKAWIEFSLRNPLAAVGADVNVMTWRQRQANLIGPMEKQRTLSVTMFGIISLVAVVLIFVIFYMIVFQKTRDIGVIKSIGGSSSGVAAIFLAYGAAIGLVGSIIGAVGGYYFVRYINPIQDWIADVFGFRVWDKDVFMFEMIPNQVNPVSAAMIVVSAVVAGIVGAMLPAYRAGRMQPVEALRYE